MKSHKLTDEEIAKWKKVIDGMSHEEMCRLWRFAEPGHAIFIDKTPVYEHFQARFKQLGGMTPEISKKIGLEDQ